MFSKIKYDFNQSKNYIILIILAIIASYSVYTYCSVNYIIYLSDENAIFELSTALFFLFASVILFLLFKNTKNIFFILLSILFFVGVGEEISWGQHLMHFSTPNYLNKVNVQHEFNLHNIEVFNTGNFDGSKKTGLHRLLEINFLFRLFCLFYGIIIPFLMMQSKKITDLINYIKMPTPNLSVGVFFMINWIVYKLVLMALPEGNNIYYYLTASEIFECIDAFIFLCISYAYYRNNLKNRKMMDAV
ncbi:MAG: hypothetical protein NT127_06595 [Sphingobacteriales bacterium]|nr:hypothetical protein [Sphingobacteriales bacterium]